MKDRRFTVPEYRYEPGKGAPILEGASIVAIVTGTQYPTGTACQADYDLARLFAAAPDLLAALQHVRDEWCEGGTLEGTEAEKLILAAIAKAEGCQS